MSPLAESLHGNEFDKLKALVSGEEGNLISLRAPRAGYGKTMLLSRLREEMKSASLMVPVELSAYFRIDEHEILRRIVDQLTAAIPGKGNVTRLDLSVRRILANALIPLVESGEVPSPNRTESLRSLRERPEEVFDFHKETAVVAQWVNAQFSALSHRLMTVIGQGCGGVTASLTRLFTSLCRFAMTPLEKRERNQNLLNEVFGSESGPTGGTGIHGTLTSFLKLITSTENVILVVDEMDGLFGDSEGALRVGNTLIALRQAAPKLKVIFSVNDDVWESTFARRIPLGMQDRFEDCVVRLKELDEDGVMALLKTRDEVGGRAIRGKIDIDEGEFYPRSVLRAAREAWSSRDQLEKEIPVTAEPTKPVSSQSNDIGFADVPAGKMVETDLAEAGKPEVPFAVPKSKPPDPPELVRRAGIPRQYLVDRIRKEVASVPSSTADPDVKANYPPKTVKRVATPRMYSVKRIRQESDSVRVPTTSPSSLSFESPFKIANQVASENSGQAETTPPPLAKDGKGVDTIDDLLREFRERHETKDLF